MVVEEVDCVFWVDAGEVELVGAEGVVLEWGGVGGVEEVEGFVEVDGAHEGRVGEHA